MSEVAKHLAGHLANAMYDMQCGQHDRAVVTLGRAYHTAVACRKSGKLDNTLAERFDHLLQAIQIAFNSIEYGSKLGYYAREYYGGGYYIHYDNGDHGLFYETAHRALWEASVQNFVGECQPYHEPVYLR